MARAYGGPGRYIQRAGEVGRLGPHLRDLGRRMLIVVDPAVAATVQPRVGPGLGPEIEATCEAFRGECTQSEIDRVADRAQAVRAEAIVALGGGKTIDTVKAAAVAAGARIAVVPTIASTDAPCSAVAVIYDDHGMYREARRLPRNPDAVIVDPAVIVAARVRFLVAGMGDALSTFFEARSNRESRTDNYVAGGFPPTAAGAAIAERCHAVLMRYAVAAKRDAALGLCTPAVEAIIEANTLLSGLGFENCGCAAAHGLHDALTHLDETHRFLHGEKVAFGTLCLLMIEDRDAGEIAAMVGFCRRLGLPATLAELGIVDDVAGKVERVAAAALRDPHGIIHATPARLSVPTVRDAVLALDAFARETA